MQVQTCGEREGRYKLGCVHWERVDPNARATMFKTTSVPGSELLLLLLVLSLSLLLLLQLSSAPTNRSRAASP